MARVLVTEKEVAASLARRGQEARTINEGARAWATDQDAPVDWPTWLQAMSHMGRRFPDTVPDYDQPSAAVRTSRQ